MARVAPLLEAGHGPDDLVAHFERLGDATAVRALASNGAALILARGGPDGLDAPAVRETLASFTERAERAAETFLPAGLREGRETRRRLDASSTSIVEHRRLLEKALRGERVTPDEMIDVGSARWAMPSSLGRRQPAEPAGRPGATDS